MRAARSASAAIIFCFLYPAAVFLALPRLLASPFTPLDGALGELSYPLYLLHWPIIGCLRSVLPRHDLLEIAMFSAIALTLSVIAARIVVVTAERADRPVPRSPPHQGDQARRPVAGHCGGDNTITSRQESVRRFWGANPRR